MNQTTPELQIKKKSQLDLILEYLKRGNRINKVAAIEKFNCYVLFARMKDIHDMIRSGELQGFRYCSERDPLHHNAMVYWLEPEELTLFNQEERAA